MFMVYFFWFECKKNSIDKGMYFFVNSLYQHVKLFVIFSGCLSLIININFARVKDVFFNKIMNNFVVENHSYPININDHDTRDI
jgi:hypothetical protein